MSSTRTRLIAICLSAVFGLLAQSAFATHFRYGYMFWERDLTYVPPAATPNLVRVKVTVDTGGRWTYSSYNTATPPPGMPVTPRVTGNPTVTCVGVPTIPPDAGTFSCPNQGSMIDFLGGLSTGITVSAPLGGTAQFYRYHLNQTPVNVAIPNTGLAVAALPMTPVVSQILPTQDTFYGRMEFYVVFDRLRPITLIWQNSNRISQLLDGNNDLAWRLQTTIDLNGANANITRSPITQAPAIMQVFTNQTNTITLPSQTFDNTVAKWRVSTFAESQLNVARPAAPSVFSLDENTGVIQFKPRTNGFYGMQFMLSSVDPSTGTVKSSVPIDVIFESTTNNNVYSETLATGDGQTTYTARVAEPFSFTVRSTTSPSAPSYSVAINAGNLPAGATFTKPACTGGAVCVGTFNWTPTVASTGSVVCFTSTLVNGATLVATSQPLCVTVDLEALATTLVTDPATGAAGGGPIMLKAKLTRTIDNSPIANRPVKFTFDGDLANPPWVSTSNALGVDTVLTDAQGFATLTVISTRAVPVAAPYRATFSAIAGEFLQSSSATNVLLTKQATTTLNAPTTAATPPLPSVGYPLSASAVLNRILTPSDGGVFGVGAMVDFTLAGPGGTQATATGGPTNTAGVATASLPAPTAVGTHSLTAYFAGNDALFGGVTSPATQVNVRQRIQITMSAGVASQNVPSPVTAQLVAIPSNTPLAGYSVRFTATGFPSQYVTTNAAGVAVGSFTFTTTGPKAVIADILPTTSQLNRNGFVTEEQSVANIDVQPAAATTMVAVPFSAFAGQPSTLTAHLATSTGPVSGANVTFKTGAVTLGAGTTDSNGDVSVNFTPVTPVLPTNYSAEFAGMPGYAPSNAIASYRVDKAASQMAALTMNAIDYVGGSLAVATSLQRVSAPAGVIPGAAVVFTLTGPAGPASQVVTLVAQTDANGAVFASLPLNARGQFTVDAAYAGTPAMAGATRSASLTVYQKTNLLANPAQGVAGAATALSAGLFAVPGGQPIANEAVTITAGSLSTTAFTNGAGVASGAVTFALPGTFTIEAAFNNLGGFYADANGNQLPTTASATAVIDVAVSSVSLTAAPNGMVGQPVSLSAVVSRVSAPAGPVSGVNVTFTINGPEGTTTLGATTDASGVAQVTYLPQEGGHYFATATYAGDSALTASTSAAANTLVIHQTALTIAPVTGFAGSALPVQAVLRTVPGDLPVNGQSITFTFIGAGAPASVSAITNAAGVATVSPTFVVPGTFTSQAVFSNAPSFYGESAAASTVTATNNAPTFSAPADITLAATSAAGRMVSFTAAGSDLEDGSIDALCTPLSGTTFPIGTTTVSCTVTDVAGASAADTFTVTIFNTAPTIGFLADITASATSAAGREVSFSATGFDAEDGVLTPVCSTAPGTFPIGSTTVTCTVTDVAGASATDTFTVTIFNTAPTISDLSDIVGEATSNAGRAITFSSTGNDTEDGALTPVCSAVPGTFPIGTTTVTCTVTDVAGATASDSFTITVRDTTAPSVTVESKTFEQTSTAGATGIFASSATDIVDGTLTTTCTPASGSTFARGTTTVTCSVTDAHGNTGSATGTITVVDTIKPVVTYTGNSGTYTADQIVNITCAATDSGSGVATTDCANITGPAHTFAVGVNTRSASATDAAGNTNSASVSFTVTVPPSSVGNVITQFFDSPTEAAKATQTLNLATSAPNASSRAAHLNKLIKDIEKEIGKTISAAEAATLIALIQNLY